MALLHRSWGFVRNGTSIVDAMPGSSPLKLLSCVVVVGFRNVSVFVIHSDIAVCGSCVGLGTWYTWNVTCSLARSSEATRGSSTHVSKEFTCFTVFYVVLTVHMTQVRPAR